MTAAAVAVVVPARDEEARIGTCVESVLTALANAPEHPAVVVVVAHRCTDRTARAAAWALGGRGLVLADDSPGLAGARAAGAAAALAWSPCAARDTWLLSTDADSAVPPDWLLRIFRHARAGALAVAGLVSVRHDPSTPPAARAAYQAIVRAGLRAEGHTHVYGANLAVRADAFLGVGGWPAVAPGEDRALVEALRRAGRPVTAATDVVVRTSGRRTPRAAGGLGTLLDRLALTDQTGAVPPEFRADAAG